MRFPEKFRALAPALPGTATNCRDEDMPDYKFVDYAIAALAKKHD